MGHSFVDEAESDVSVGRGVWRSRPGNLGFLPLSFGTVGEQVIGVPRTHHASTGESKCDPRGIDGDPPPTPLFGDVGGCTGTAGRIKHEITGVGGHEDATLNDGLRRLYDIDLVSHETCTDVIPSICDLNSREVVQVTHIA